MLRCLGGLLSLFVLGQAGQAMAASSLAPPAAGSYALERILRTPDGTVLDSDGKVQPLGRYTRGRVTLFSFIYTYCTDAKGCPLAYATLHELKGILDGEKGLREQVRFVSMSFDPEYDTPPAMRSYGGADARDTRGLPWHFLTSRSAADLQPILAGFGQDVTVLSSRQPGQRVPSISHMLKIFLLDRKGTVREIYSPSYLQTTILVNDIKTLLHEKLD